MSSIDNRIVNMVFNNKGFEAGVASTLASLKKLNESLKMKDTGKGLDEVGKGINKLNASGIGALGSAVDGVTSKFSAMGVIAASALATITSKAVNAGTALVKSLTIDPITTGLSEYETKMNAIQTILTNTSHQGTTLTDVNKALGELNTYADKTIYNFAQMTDNIGKFTAAGVNLDTSVAAIKGIANLAAASGSSSAQASTAMYQLSQALAAGKVSLMDWNSVVNAGMGGKLFQDALIRTSEHLGTGAEAMIEKFGSFRESLTKGEWLTTDVLTETLKQISGAYTEADLMAQGYTKSQAKAIVELAKNATAAATEVKTVSQLFDTMKESVQSGWAQTWEHIIGDKDQATEVLTRVKDTFDNIVNPIAEARNKMFEEWNKGGGRDAVIEGFANVFSGIGKVAGSVKEAFTDIFPPMTGQKLIELSKGFQNFTEKLKVSDSTAAKIKDTFKGVFSVFDIAKTGIVSLFKAFAPAGGILGGLTNGFLTVTSNVGKFITSLSGGIKASGIFDKMSNTISNSLKGIGDGFSKAGDFISNVFKSIGKLDLQPLMNFFGQTFQGFGKGLTDILSGIGKAVGNLNLNTLLGGLTALASKGIFDKIGGIFDNLAGSIKNITSIGSNISEILSSITGTLKAMANDINAGALLKVAAAVGILAVSLSALSTIEGGKLESALTGLATTMALLVGAFAALSKVSSGGSKGGLLGNLIGGFFGKGDLLTTATSLVVFSSAVLVLAGAIKTLSSLNPGELITGLAGVAGSLALLVGAAKLLDGINGSLVKAGASMVLMAAAMNVMASAVGKFSQINPNNMIVGLMGVGTALLELAAFMKITDFNGMGIRSSTGILLLSASLLVLQNAVAQFGSMDIGALIQGLLGVAGALGIIAGFSHLNSSATGMLVTAAALVVMGGALHALSSAVRSMAGMQWDDMARGLTTMAASLLILAAAVKLMSGLGLAAVGAGLIVASSGLLVMGTAIKSLAELSWDEMARGLVALAGGLTVLGVAAAAMSGMVVGAAAILVLAGAMAVLTPQLVAMSQLSWGQIGAGLTMLGGSLVILGVAGLAATAIAPGLLALGAAVALLGAGCLAAGAGVTMFATGLATLAAVGAAGGLALAEILRQLINLLPQLGSKLGEALVNMAKAIGDGIPTLVTAFGQMLTGFLEAFAKFTPQIVKLGVELITTLCEALLQAGPKLIQVAVKLTLMLINGLANAAGQLAEAGANLVINLINGLSSHIGDVVQATIDLGIAIIEGLTQGIENNAERFGTALGNLLKAAIDSSGTMAKAMLKQVGTSSMVELAAGVLSKAGEVLQSVGRVVSDAIKAAKAKVGEFLSAGKEWISNLASGIKNTISTVISAVSNLVSNVVQKVRSGISQFLNAGREWISNLASGVRGAVGSVTSAISSMVSNAVQNVTSAASRFLSAAKQWVSQLASGIRSGASSVTSAVKSCITSAVNAVRGAASQFVSAGRSMITGLVSGIKSAAASVASAARSVVQNAINAAKKALKINSPSKVFIGLGKSTGEGLVIGIDRTSNDVARSATNMAETAISTVRNSINRIAEAANTSIDSQPTITPILDLSNIEAGSRNLNNMLSTSSINAELSGTISRNIGVIQNRNDNTELLSAIKDLQGNINNTGNTYQINGITYDDGSNIQAAIETLIRATTIERRI